MPAPHAVWLGLLAAALLAAWLFIFSPLSAPLGAAGGAMEDMGDHSSPSRLSAPAATRPPSATSATSAILNTALLPDPNKPHPNLLFVLPPKVGGTTITVVLERVASTWKKAIAKQPARMGHYMCTSEPGSAETFWKHLLAKNDALEVFFGPMCFHSFLINQPERWQGGRKPLVLGLVRDPWARWVSAWRFLEKRCDEKDPNMPPDIARHCTTLLPIGLEAYTVNTCVHSLVGSCSEQHRWLAPVHHAPPEDLFGKVYDFIMVLEKFDESLAVLHFDYGFPASALPYVRVNSDSKAPFPRVSPSVMSKALDQGLKKDMETHKRAMEYLNSRIRDLNKSTNGELNSFLNRLRRANSLAVENCGSSKEQVFILNNFDEGFKVTSEMRNSVTECLDKQWELTFDA